MQTSNQAAAVSSIPSQSALKSTLAAGSAKKLIAQMRAKKAISKNRKRFKRRLRMGRLYPLIKF